jgi:hypothetical protein
LPEISKELVALLGFLAPGFIVAWIFYGFTPYEKPSQFERTVQALVFTVIIYALVEFEKSALEVIGTIYSVGAWSSNIKITLSILNAIAFGFIISRLVRQDQIHKIATKFGLTRKSGYPNEHYAAFADEPRWVALYLKDQTRIYGWPIRWPTEGTKGHYLLTQAQRSWIDLPDEPPQELDSFGIHSILITASDVKYIEFIPEVINNGN